MKVMLMMKTKPFAKGKCFGSPDRQRDSLVYFIWFKFHNLISVCLCMLNCKFYLVRSRIIFYVNQLLFRVYSRLVACQKDGCLHNVYMRGRVVSGRVVLIPTQPLRSTTRPYNFVKNCQIVKKREKWNLRIFVTFIGWSVFW